MVRPTSLMGGSTRDLVGIQARALQRLGNRARAGGLWPRRHGRRSLGAATLVGELKNGEISEYEVHPEDFGLAMASNRALKVETPEQSRAMLVGVLDNQPGAARDIVILNAGVGFTANVAATVNGGIEKARAAVESEGRQGAAGAVCGGDAGAGGLSDV